MLSHLAGLAVVVYVGNILAPLLIWQIKKDQMPSVVPYAKEALNFQITMSICMVVGSAMAKLLCFFWVIPSAVVLFDVVMSIVAALKANSGEFYRYPVTLRLIQ